MASRKPSTSSDAQTIDVSDEVNTVPTVKDPYIILKGYTIHNDKSDKDMIEAVVENAVDFTRI